MTEKKNHFFSKLITDLTSLVFTLFRIIPNLVYIVETESQLAGKSIVSLLILFMFAGALLTTTWICVIALFVVYFVSLHLSWMLSLLLVIVINFLLLVITALLVAKVKNNLSFAKTRKMLKQIGSR